jgi:hypothetical protein
MGYFWPHRNRHVRDGPATHKIHSLSGCDAVLPSQRCMDMCGWMDPMQLDKTWMRAMRHLCELKQRARLTGCACAELLAHQTVTVKLVRTNRQLERLAHLKRLAQARMSASIVVCVVTGRFTLVSSAPFTTLPLLSSGIPWGAGATTEAVRRRCSCTVGHGACAVGDDRPSDSG